VPLCGGKFSLFLIVHRRGARHTGRHQPSPGKCHGDLLRQRLKGGLRHAALKGIRPDRRPRLIRRSALNERGPFLDSDLSVAE
jgi:hypothetical protein